MSSSASETFRLEAFADAVFAIAITLLVIEIHLPPHEEVLRLGGVAAALASLWPSYVGYAISFIVTGIMWANHHNLMKLVARVDHGFLTLTLLLLVCVAFHRDGDLLFPDVSSRGGARPATDREPCVRRRIPCDYTRLRAGVDAVSVGHTTRLCPCGAESAIVVGLAILYMLPRASAHAAATR